ncbi:MAG: hypothetical protein ACE5I1_21430 [bacterium]
MIFPSMRALPAANLGKLLVQWQYKPPYIKGLLIGAGIVAVFVFVIYLFVFSPEGFDFLKPYRSVLLYLAVPLISYFFSKVISSTRMRAYVLYEKGFLIYYGKPENKKSAGNWAPWNDFMRAELNDNGIRIFPKKPLQQKIFFYCKSNRLNAYGIIASQIGQYKFLGFDEGKGK